MHVFPLAISKPQQYKIIYKLVDLSLLAGLTLLDSYNYISDQLKKFKHISDCPNSLFLPIGIMSTGHLSGAAGAKVKKSHF